MEVDVSVQVRNFSPTDLRKLDGFDTREVDGILQVRASFLGSDDSVENSIIEFIEAVERASPDVLRSTDILELAYYFDANKQAYFSISLSARLAAFIAARGMQLKLVGYPCTN